MKYRPLMTACLGIFVVIAIMTLMGKGRFIKDLRPALLAQMAENGDHIKVSGRIYKKELKSEYQLLYLKETSIYYQQQVLQESKIIVYDKTKHPISIGNRVRAEGAVAFMQSSGNPGNFDEKIYWQKQGIKVKLWSESVEISNRERNTIGEGLFEFREKWKEALYKVMGVKSGAVMAGIMLGDKTDMDAELKELYQVNGIGHILAISGLHLSFIGLSTYRCLRRLSGSFAIGGVVGILFLLSYIAMIGLTVSAIRALVMFLFRVGADMTGRHYDASTALSAALAIVVIWRPLYIFDGGFWLSFGAVFGALAVVPLFQGLPVKGLWASVGINLVIMPILLYYFYEFPLYSVLLNVWIIPLLSVLLLFGMLGSIIYLIVPAAGSGVLWMCKLILNLYEGSCVFALKLPGARIVTGQPPIWRIFVYYFIVTAALILWVHCKKKKETIYIAIVILSAFCAMFILINPWKLGSGMLEITMLDVGQGDGIFIQDPNGTTYFIDGGSSDVKQVGRYRLEPFLKWKAVRKLDYVILSHGDADHTNGIEEMLNRRQTGVRIQNIVLPPENFWDEGLERIAQVAQKAGTKILIMEQGEKLGGQKLSITCIHPGKDCKEPAGNAASMVLEMSYGEFDLLLTGDVEGEGEEQLLKYSLSEVDVLKVAHHGSRNSTSEKFLLQTKPAIALISAGKKNRYKHPHVETIKRLQDIGCDIYSTQKSGAVTIRTNGTEMKMSRFRED